MYKIIIALLLTGIMYGQQKVEMVPYMLVPSIDECGVEIELMHPVTFDGMIRVQREEGKQIMFERAVYELTNQFASNDVFMVDGKSYYLLRIPYTGVSWNRDR